MRKFKNVGRVALAAALMTAIVISIVVLVSFVKAEVTDKTRSRWSYGNDASVRKHVVITITDGLDYLTEIPQLANTVIDRIVIDTLGTDTAFEVTLWDDTADANDPNGVALFTKTDCTTASTPYNYTVVSTDTGGNLTRGIAAGSPVKLELEAWGDTTASEVTVVIYYRQEWQ